MDITTHEVVEKKNFTVNGQTMEKEEITKVFLIEPWDTNRESSESQNKVDGGLRRGGGTGVSLIVFGVWAIWGVGLWFWFNA